MWAVTASDYDKSWLEIKNFGVEAINEGANSIDLAAWSDASSAHLAVICFWWQTARSRGLTLKITGMNATFKTLAELGGLSFIETGELDAGQ